jgi:actin related protein 2/3 complex subunit 1A/1B
MNVAESSTSTEQNTIHQNSIKQIVGFQGDARGFNKVSTCGIDGQVVLWDFKTLEGQFSALKIQ